MPLLLRDARTGETHRLDPERALIGTSDHADVRPKSGPLLAALVVRYPTGWAIHSLTDHPPLVLNGKPLPFGRRSPLGHDDTLECGEVAYRVEADHRGSAPHRALGDDTPTVCHVTVRGPDGLEECRVIDH